MEFRKQNEQGRRMLSYGITATLCMSILLGVGKMYFVWRRWQVDYNAEKKPWDRVV